jgi:sulfofructose kinase
VKLPLPLPTADRTTDLLAVGENSVDLIAVLGSHPQANAKEPLLDYVELPGGEAASAAVGVARLGWRAKYIGRFGDNRLGDLARQHLRAEGVNLDDAVTVPGTPNRLAVILVNRLTGDRTVLWHRHPQLALRSDDVSEAVLEQSRVLLVGSDDVQAMTSIARRARACGVRTVGDLERVHDGTGDLLAQLDVIVMASSFPETFTGEKHLGTALRKIASDTRAPLICVTLGSEGCLALANGHEVHVPGFAIQPVDTTGAGDLFRAGLIARWLAEPEQPDVGDLLRYANAVAALNCRAVGAQTAAPRPAEVDALLGR